MRPVPSPCKAGPCTRQAAAPPLGPWLPALPPVTAGGPPGHCPKRSRAVRAASRPRAVPAGPPRGGAGAAGCVCWSRIQHLRRPRLLLPVFSARVHARVCVCAVHVCSLRLFTYESASVSSDRFLTACAISAPSICLSDGTSSAVASGRPRGRRPRLASDLRGEALGLNACDVSGRVFVGGLYRVKKASFSSCFECWCLVVKGCWIPSDAFSVSIEIIM